jgi:hypothetical protein
LLELRDLGASPLSFDVSDQVRASFEIPSVGPALVTYERSEADEAHPVSVLVAAGDLGIPAAHQSASERKRARRLATWSVDLLSRVVTTIDPLYAAIGVEVTLPPPSELRVGRGRLGTEIYVSSRLLTSSPRLEAELRRVWADGSVEPWSRGLFLSGWEPFNAAGLTIPDPQAVDRRVTKLLGDSLRHRT